MSDSNRVGLYYLAEVTWGTIPSAAMTECRYTGESLSFSIDTTVSDEIRADRQVTDLIQTGASPSGDINFELSYGTYDDFLKSALYSSGWIGVGGGSTNTLTAGATASNLNFSLDATANTITLGSAVTHAITKGQWIKIAGAASENNGYHKVTGVTGNVITIDDVVTTEVLQSVATISGSTIKNGTTESSFVLEKKFSDISKFMSFTGMVPSNMNLSLQANSIATGSFSFMGKTSATASATVGTGTATSASTTQVMNAVSNIASIREGGTAMTGLFVQTLDFSLNNNVRGITAIGTLGNADMGVGRCEVTGNLSVYLANMDLYEKFVNDTATSLDFRIADNAGNAYTVSFDNVNFTDASITSSGPNADVYVDMQWQALRNSTYDSTIRIDRFAA